VEIVYELSEEQKASCEVLERVGEQSTEVLDYIPAQLRIVAHVRPSYKVRRDGEITMITAPMPPLPLPKSNASPNLLAHIITSKFVDHAPLARVSGMLERHGIGIARSTLTDWELACADLSEVLWSALVRHVQAAPVIHSDDTKLRLQDNARKGPTRRAHVWGYLSSGATLLPDGSWRDYPKAVVFEFALDRGGKHPRRFLDGYAGYVQADAYSGYDALYADGRIIEVGCMAHARRGFHEITVTQKTPGVAHEAVARIRALYQIEAEIKDLDPAQRAQAREERAVPLLADMHLWLAAQQKAVLPKSPLGKAIAYALNHWKALTRYTEAGYLEIDNTRLERAIRPIAMGRRNYLFVGSERGGRAAAIFYSLVETCKMAGVEPFAWLADVLARVPSHPADRIDELLPFNWQPLKPPGSPPLPPGAAPD
jgi:transposase